MGATTTRGQLGTGVAAGNAESRVRNETRCRARAGGGRDGDGATQREWHFGISASMAGMTAKSVSRTGRSTATLHETHATSARPCANARHHPTPCHSLTNSVVSVDST